MRAVGGKEDAADVGGDFCAQVEARDVGLGVLLEMELAVLPGDGWEDGAACGGEARMVVADEELEAVQTALLEAREEVARFSFELPVHTVYVSAFYMDRYEFVEFPIWKLPAGMRAMPVGTGSSFASTRNRSWSDTCPASPPRHSTGSTFPSPAGRKPQNPIPRTTAPGHSNSRPHRWKPAPRHAASGNRNRRGRRKCPPSSPRLSSCMQKRTSACEQKRTEG